MIRKYSSISQFRSLLLCGIGYLTLASSGVGNPDDWQELRQRLVENRLRLTENLQFCLECRIKSQELILENEFTLPISNSAYLLATNGSAWRYSEVIQGDEKVFFSVYSNNEIRTKNKRMYWSATAVITDGSGGSYFQGLDFLDFLSFDVGEILEESGFVPKRHPSEKEQMKYQRPQFGLVQTLDVAKRFPGASIVTEKIGDLDCLTVKYGKEFFSVCPKLNYALVQRKAAFSDTDITKFHLTCTDFFSPGKGLFVPRNVEQKIYGKFSEKPELHNKVVGIVKYRLSRFSFEKPDDKLFAPEFPEGFYVADFVNGINYQVARHSSLGHGAAQSKKLINRPGSRRKQIQSVAIVVGMILFTLGICVVVWRKRRTRYA